MNAITGTFKYFGLSQKSKLNSDFSPDLNCSARISD